MQARAGHATKITGQSRLPFVLWDSCLLAFFALLLSSTFRSLRNAERSQSRKQKQQPRARSPTATQPRGCPDIRLRAGWSARKPTSSSWSASCATPSRPDSRALSRRAREHHLLFPPRAARQTPRGSAATRSRLQNQTCSWPGSAQSSPKAETSTARMQRCREQEQRCRRRKASAWGRESTPPHKAARRSQTPQPALT